MLDMRNGIMIGCFLLLGVMIVIAQEECSVQVEEALDRTAAACSGLARNEICYGNNSLLAESSAPDFAFVDVGDVESILKLQSLHTAPYDAANDIWGIATLVLQANLPDTLPGQNVTMLIFGDTTIETAVASSLILPVTTNASSRIRSSTDTSNDSNVIEAIPAGVTVTADGRNANGEWLRIRLGDYQEALTGRKGWVASFLVDGDSERMSLPEVDVSTPSYAPMQAFYLSTGISDTTCAEVPPDGLLIQTPEGAGFVNFEVNGVEIWLGSTAFLEVTPDQELSIALVEGGGSAVAEGSGQWIPAGTFVTVPLTEDGKAPSAAPSAPQPYDYERLSLLPVEIALPQTIEVVPSLPEEEIEIAVEELVSKTGFLPGVYLIQPTNVITHIDTTGQGLCNAYVPASWSWVVDFGEGCMFGDPSGTAGCGLLQMGGNVYGFDYGQDTVEGSLRVTWISPSQFVIETHEHNQWQNASGQQFETNCEMHAAATLNR